MTAIDISPELAGLLNAAEHAQVRAILNSHRKALVADLPSGPASVVGRIVRDARGRRHAALKSGCQK
jgi:hypothetical protein